MVIPSTFGRWCGVRQGPADRGSDNAFSMVRRLTPSRVRCKGGEQPVSGAGCPMVPASALECSRKPRWMISIASPVAAQCRFEAVFVSNAKTQRNMKRTEMTLPSPVFKGLVPSR